MHHLNQRHLCHRVEEVQADEPTRIGERRSQFFELDRGGVGRNDCTGSQPGLEFSVERTLRIDVFHDGLDHEIGRRDAIACKIRTQSRIGRNALCRILDAFLEERCSTLEGRSELRL